MYIYMDIFISLFIYAFIYLFIICIFMYLTVYRYFNCILVKSCTSVVSFTGGPHIKPCCFLKEQSGHFGHTQVRKSISEENPWQVWKVAVGWAVYALLCLKAPHGTQFIPLEPCAWLEKARLNSISKSCEAQGFHVQIPKGPYCHVTECHVNGISRRSHCHSIGNLHQFEIQSTNICQITHISNMCYGATSFKSGSLFECV